MRRPILRPLAVLAASATLVLLSACSGGGEGGNDAPGDDSEQGNEVSSDQWMAENCPTTVVKVDASASVSGENPTPYALTVGPVTAPQVGENESEIRLYTYDGTTDEFSPLRVVEQGETFCFNADAETKTGYSEPSETDAEFATVASAEHPEGVWIDSVPQAVPLTEAGEPNFDGRGLKAEYYWTTTAVDESVLSEASETVQYCEISECV